jgi:hypothetical protein
LIESHLGIISKPLGCTYHNLTDPAARVEILGHRTEQLKLSVGRQMLGVSIRTSLQAISDEPIRTRGAMMKA